MRRTGVRRLRGILEKTALGRVLSSGVAEDEADWVEKVGGKRVSITDGKIMVEGGLLGGETKEGDANDSAEAEVAWIASTIHMLLFHARKSLSRD